MEKGAPQNRRGSPDRSQRAVLAGLPIELWALIVGHCHADDLASLVRVCGALRECAWARVDNTCRATHASVDAFIARWEQKSAACDATLVAMSCSCLRGSSPQTTAAWLALLPPFSCRRWSLVDASSPKAHFMFFLYLYRVRNEKTPAARRRAWVRGRLAHTLPTILFFFHPLPHGRRENKSSRRATKKTTADRSSLLRARALWRY